MDQFLLKNAALYHNLVKKLAPPPVSRVAKVATEPNPDMVISARIRPLLEEDIAMGFPSAVFPSKIEPGVVDIHDLYNSPRGRPVLKSSNYEVDRLFGPETTTEQIYENMVVDLVPFAWNGGIGTLFTYGQTGSGKTFTVSRLEQLVASSIMSSSQEAAPRQIYITIIDLSGQSAFDLLNSRNPIQILEDSFGVTQLAGANEHLAENEQQMTDLIDQAASFRRTASTMKNDASSRSHAICRIRIHDPAFGTDGHLYLIDLAGSEAARDIATHGADRMRETREINISLSVLKDCIRGKVQFDLLKSSGAKQKKLPHVPFRQSALTKVLKHVFDPAGNKACKTIVIACVNPSLGDVGPSRNTLRYAELLRVLVPVTAKVEANPAAPMDWSNVQLREWISKNSGTPPISPSHLSPTESGAQLLRLPSPDFQARCLKTPGVTIEQATAFRSKLWQLHIDSQHTPSSSTNTKLSSKCLLRDGDEKEDFRERIKSGMVVSYKTDGDEGDAELGFVLSKGDGEGNDAYVCGKVTKGFMEGSYVVNLWDQIVVPLGELEKEVFLEYDVGTRYYYISV